MNLNSTPTPRSNLPLTFMTTFTVTCRPKRILELVVGTAFASLLLSGCASVGAPSKLTLDLPEKWSEAAPATAPAGNLPGANWWTGFDSSELNRLVALSLDSSPDLNVALSRITQAEAAVAISGASLFPSLSLGANTGSRVSKSPGQDSFTSNSSGVNLGISYEVDLWGRLAANTRSAQASLKASRFDLETARLSLITGVANAYFQTLTVRARLIVARDNLALAERLLRIVDVRYRNGAASALDLSRQQTAVLSQRATIKPLEVQERQTLTAVAVLVGRVPQGFSIANQDIQTLLLPSIAPSLPSQLLTRRPDLARAEAQLLAADANLDAARAALLPGIQLSASGGLSTDGLLSLADPSRSVGITASISQAIFDGGRLRKQVQISDAQRYQLLETYRKSVLTALKEVEDALSNVARYQDQESALIGIRDEARRSLDLAELRYKEGAGDLSSVLDAQRTLYSAQDQLVQVRFSRLSTSLDLIKSVGGSPNDQIK